MGIDVRRIIAFTWVIAAITGCISGILMANVNTLTPHLGLVALNVLAVVILGGMNSIGGVLVAGFIIGWLEAVTGWVLGTEFREITPYILVLLSFSCVRPGCSAPKKSRGSDGRAAVQHHARENLRARARRRSILWICPACCRAAALPLVAPRYWVYFAGLLGINIIATHGLNIMMGYTGLLSLGHAAFVGVGAYTVALAQLHLGLPFYLRFRSAGVAAAVIGIGLRPALAADPRPLSRHRDTGRAVHPEFRLRPLAERDEWRRRTDRAAGDRFRFR